MILVTGASGHLGNALVRELVTDGRGVRAMVHRDPDPPSLRGLDVPRVRADVTVPYTLAAALEGVDAVVHLAGPTSGHGTPAAFEQIHVEGTRAVLAAARAAGVRRVVYVGSVQALARPGGGERLDETSPLATTGGAYERAKAAATRLALAQTDPQVVVVHPTGVVGPLDFGPSALGTQVRRWALGGPAVSVSGGVDLVDVRDVARGLVGALDLGRPGAAYLLGGRDVRLPDFAREVVRAAGRSGRVVTVPGRAAYVGAQLAQVIGRVRRSPTTFTPYAVRLLQAPLVTVDWSRARDELGYSVRPWEQTVADTTQWWLEHPRPSRG